MGFFFTQAQKQDKNLKGISPAFLRRHECDVCPLNAAKDLVTPKMEPTGNDKPEVLFVGEYPSQTDDDKGQQFSGKAGKILRARISKEWLPKIRWTNSIRCHPKKVPESVELNACSPKLERDVAATKPKAIFGFGNIPLVQIANMPSEHRGAWLWRGRKLPVNVAGHLCWYFPMLSPVELLKKRKFEPRDLNTYGSEDEFAFVLDLKRAFAQVDNLPEPIIHSIDEAAADIELPTSVDRIAELLDIVAHDPSTGVDIETNGLRPYVEGAKILSIAFSGKNETFAFALDHSQATWTKLQRKQLDVLVKRFLYEATCKKVVHHLPFELEWFGFFYGKGCFFAGRWEDSESQAFVLDNRRGSLSLDFLCLQYFGFNIKAISGLDRKNLDKSPLKQVLNYNGIDARYHRLLFLEQVKRIKIEGLLDVYEHQLRRLPTLVLTQMQGVPIDQTVVRSLKKKYEGYALKFLTAIDNDEDVIEFTRRKGKEFNPASPHDVNYLFKEIVKVDLANVDKNELSHVDHPVADLVVKYREAKKNISTYIDPVDETSEENVLFPGGVLHPIISTTRVVSARTSSDSPNIQNWPKRDEERKEVRSQIKSPDVDMRVVSFDYAGIQARNVAMESLDKVLVEAFWNDYDIHTVWRERIAKKFPNWIPRAKAQDKEALKHYRYLAKNKFVFPAFFGAQAYTISEGLGLSKNVCEELREEFFDEFKGIKKWHSYQDDFYYEHGYVTGLSKYRCNGPISANQRINLPIQGDEAYIVIDAMNRLADMQDPRYQPMLEVHDDITFLMPYKEIEKRAEVVIKTLINVPFKWANVVPIEVEMSVGKDWINMTEVGKYANNKWNGIVESKSDL